MKCCVNIACALRWGVAFVGVYSTGHGSPFMGKHFRCKEYNGGRCSFEATIIKKSGLWLYKKNLFVNFMCKLVLPHNLLCKRVVIKPL